TFDGSVVRIARGSVVPEERSGKVAMPLSTRFPSAVSAAARGMSNALRRSATVSPIPFIKRPNRFHGLALAVRKEQLTRIIQNLDRRLYVRGVEWVLWRPAS